MAGEFLYLVGDWVHLVMVGLLLALRPDQRRSLLWAGGLLVPTVVLGPLSGGDRWIAPTIGGRAIGVEDLLFCFCFGALAWAFAVPRGSAYLVDPAAAGFFRRLALVGAIGLVAYFALLGAGVPPGWVYDALPAGLGLAMVALRPPLALTALRGAVLFTLYYVAMLAAMIALFGAPFRALWTVGPGPHVLGLPLEEILFATSLGAAWAPFLIWASDRQRARITGRGARIPWCRSGD